MELLEVPMPPPFPSDRRKEGRTSPRARAGGPEISKEPSAALGVSAANIRRLVSTAKLPLVRLTRRLLSLKEAALVLGVSTATVPTTRLAEPSASRQVQPPRPRRRQGRG